MIGLLGFHKMEAFRTALPYLVPAHCVMYFTQRGPGAGQYLSQRLGKQGRQQGRGDDRPARQGQAQ